jgi:hypothetical protein
MKGKDNLLLILPSTDHSLHLGLLQVQPYK